MPPEVTTNSLGVSVIRLTRADGQMIELTDNPAIQIVAQDTYDPSCLVRWPMRWERDAIPRPSEE